MGYVTEADNADSERVVTNLALAILADVPGLAEAASLHAEQELPGIQERLLRGGEDPTRLVASIAEIVAGGLVSEAAELPFDVAVTTRLLGERLANGGIGLDALLELVYTVSNEAEALLVEGSRHPVEALAALRRLKRLEGALTLTLTRGFVETSIEDFLEQERALRALITIARAVARSLEPAEVAEAGLRETIAATNLDAGGLWLVDATGIGFRLQHTVGLKPDELAFLETYDLTRHPAIADSLLSGIPAQLKLASERHPQLGAFHASLVVPLRGSHRLLGVMALGSRDARVFSSDEVIFAGAVADHMAIALDHALEHRLEAHTDYLTGLANRAEFENALRRELAAASRTRRPLTLVLMDLNDLKGINDGHGHHAGDEAIRAVGQALRMVVRTSDVSARLGGDEFGVAMPEADLAQAQEVVSRIRATLVEMNRTGRRPYPVELSYGLAEWEPGFDFQRLFKVADARLYRDKRRRRVQVIGATPDLKITASNASS